MSEEKFRSAVGAALELARFRSLNRDESAILWSHYRLQAAERELEAAISREEMLGDQLDIADEHVKELKAQLSAYEIALAGIPDSYADEVNRRVANLVEDV